MSYYVEYVFMYGVTTDDGDECEPVPTYLILKYPSFAHANIADDVRVQGLMSHGLSYSIDNFLEDLCEKGFLFEIIEPNRVIQFSDVLSASSKEDKDKPKGTNHEVMIYG